MAIHEITWGEVAPVKVSHLPVMTGSVKFFSEDKGFGFIAPDAEPGRTLDDLFFHVSALGGQNVYQDDIVQFEISEGPKGPIAIRVKAVTK